jgi:hypothetical protein
VKSRGHAIFVQNVAMISDLRSLFGPSNFSLLRDPVLPILALSRNSI